MREITLTINGEPRTVTADVRSTLLDLLRERLHLTGTKKGCDSTASRRSTGSPSAWLPAAGSTPMR
jgi:aerobic-type carbon monoxide dehydrogenase small subunit (CoxS/CutS family)